MAHLSLHKRCLKIKKLFDVEVSKPRLMRFYKRNGLRYGMAKSELYPHHKNLDLLQQERIAYAMKLSDFILDDDVEVIYFDETSFHSYVSILWARLILFAFCFVGGWL
jgi:hypothetical protein